MSYFDFLIIHKVIDKKWVQQFDCPLTVYDFKKAYSLIGYSPSDPMHHYLRHNSLYKNKLKSYLFENMSEDIISINFPPKFEFLNSNRFGNPQVLSKSILMAKTTRKKKIEIQILAGNTLESCLHSCSQISTTLVVVHIIQQGLFEIQANTRFS